MLPRLLALTFGFLLSVTIAAQGAETPRTELQGEPYGGALRELTSLAFDRDGTLWIGSRYNGILAYRQEKFFLYNAYNSPIPDEGISAVYVDAKNTKWFGTVRGYLYGFDGKRWQIFTVAKDPRESRETITCIRGDANGRIWFITERSRLFWLEKGKVETIDKKATLTAGGVPCLDFDRQGHLWVARTGSLLHFDGQRWERRGDEQTRQLAISSLSCSAKDDAVYLGTPDGPYVYKDGHCRKLAEDVEISRIEAIRAAADGRFAAGYMAPHGAIIGDGRQVKRYTFGTPLEGETVTDIAFDKQGRIWFAGRFVGLCRFDNGKWKTFLQRNDENPRAHSTPLPAWQKKPLADLVREEAIGTDIHTS